MKRLGIFADVSNLYYCIQKKYNRKLSYKKYMSFCADLGHIELAIAYGAQVGNEASGFIHALEGIGYQTKYKEPDTYELQKRKADWDVGICIDMVNLHTRLDTVILGSADGDLAPAVEWLAAHNVSTIVLASGISRKLRDIASCIEISELLLEDK